MLHALVAIAPVHFVASSIETSQDTDDDDTVPVTSLPCRWKVPKSRKESNLKMSDAKFEKHVYGRTSSVNYARQEDFDPRPTKYHGSAQCLLKELLVKVRGRGLGISLLFDESQGIGVILIKKSFLDLTFHKNSNLKSLLKSLRSV